MNTQAKTRTRSQRSATPSGGNNSEQATSVVVRASKEKNQLSTPSGDCNLRVENSSSSSSMDDIKSWMTSLSQHMLEIKTELRAISENMLAKIDDLSQRVVLLENNWTAENTKLKIRIAQLEQRIDTASGGVSDLRMDQFVEELEERERRKKNIILCNLDESNCHNISEAMDDDKQRVMHTLRNVVPSLDASSFRCFRLGRPSDRPRPIKIVLTDAGLVRDIFYNIKQLPAKVRLYRDQTVMQRNIFLQMKNDLEERKKRGEDGLFIKYIKGRPRIVKSNGSKNSIVITKTSED